MSEIYKLRQRLSNINRHAIEYKMTVAEANNLLKEIDELLKPQVVVQSDEEIAEPNIIYRVMDGGSL